MKKTNCEKCGAEFEYEPSIVCGREFLPRKLCNEHQTERDAQREKDRIEHEEQTKREIFTMNWHQVCPPIYRDSDPSRINQECLRAAMQWDFNSAKGIGMLGASGAGKTRALFMAVKRAVEAGKRCESVSHTKLSRIVMEAFSGDGSTRAEAVDAMKRYRNCRILLLDDVGKPPSTERADSELEELIEHRTSHMLPILWSANGSSEWMKKRFGADRGEPMVRRLSEFSEIVKV